MSLRVRDMPEQAESQIALLRPFKLNLRTGARSFALATGVQLPHEGVPKFNFGTRKTWIAEAPGRIIQFNGKWLLRPNPDVKNESLELHDS